MLPREQEDLLLSCYDKLSQNPSRLHSFGVGTTRQEILEIVAGKQISAHDERCKQYGLPNTTPSHLLAKIHALSMELKDYREDDNRVP